MKMNTFINLDDKEDIFVIENYSNEVQEIMTAPPKWIIRRGVAVIFYILLTILFVSYFVKYPDTVKATVTITSLNSPAEIKSKSFGRINILVKDNENVKKGDLLGFIENTSNIDDIKILEREMEFAEKEIANLHYNNLPTHDGLRLGELQDIYSAYIKNIKEFKLYSKLDNYEKNINALKQQTEIYSKIEDQLLKQKDISMEELKLAKNKVAVDSFLLKEKVIAKLDYQSTVSRYLPYKKTVEQFDQTIINNKLRVEEIKTKISEVTINNYETQSRLLSNILSSYYSLISQLNSWKQRYLFISPIDGKVSYFKFWNNNQNAVNGETIVSVVPNQNNIFAYMLTPMAGSGKIAIGQTVNIKLDTYPSNEFGIVKGKIKSISTVPQDNNYAIIVELPVELVTTQNKKLEYKEQMKGSAEIITKDYRIIERFFYQINKMVENFE